MCIVSRYLCKMGNTLCKDRGNQANKCKSPVDRIIGRCSQICPNSLGKRKHFWDKQVLETSPPLQTQPKMNETGWHSEALTVPDSPKNNSQQPVAPPRKKRSSTLKRDEQPTRNGFKDIFHDQSVSSESESQDISDAKDFTDFEKVPLNSAIEKEARLNDKASRSSEEREERNAVSLTRKVSKVGNKKSDKFFGENLSDCLSDEPVVSSDEEKSATSIDPKTEKLNKKEKENEKEEKEKSEFDMNVQDSEELIRKINKERGNLLFAMKDCTDDESTDELDGKPPVQEEIIVPKRRVIRHICDDTDSLKPHVHKTAPDPNAPKKPQRDFTKYKKSLEDIRNDSKVLADSIVTDTKIKSPMKDITLDKKIDELLLSKDVVDSPPAPTLKRVSESIPAQMSHSEKVLRRSLSTQSYLTQDLIDTIAKQASDLSISDKYVPEDYINFSDGSGLVSPNSKLNQKRSLTSQQSNPDSPIFSIGHQEVHYELPLSSVVTPTEKDIIAVDSRELPTEPKAKTTVADIVTNLVKDKFSEHALEHKGLIATKLDKPTDEKNVPKDKNIIEEHKYSDREQCLRNIPKDENTTEHSDREHSPSEDISKAIKSFVEKDDLKPEDVLVLLEEEFGELLNSKSLPVEDIKIIEELKKVVHTGLNEQQRESSPKENIKHEENNISTKVNSIKKESTPAKESIEPKTIKEEITKVNTSYTTDDHDDLKEESQKAKVSEIYYEGANINNKSPVVPLKNINNTTQATDVKVSNEKRRHSIDDLDHWFLGSSSSSSSSNALKVDFPERKRKREKSYPGCLHSESLKEEFENIASNLSTPEESNNMIMTKTIKLSETPSNNNNNVNDNDNDDHTNNVNDTFDESVKDKRKSVGHSLLLKFLDIERNQY